VTYTTLANGWVQKGDMKRAEAVFAEMEASGIAPNLITFQVRAHHDFVWRWGAPRLTFLLCEQTLIYGHTKSKDIQSALRVLEVCIRSLAATLG